MAGLMTRDSEKMPQAEAKPMGDEQDSVPNVAPEEQAQYNQFINNGYNLIYDEKTIESIRESLKGDGDPVEGLAQTVATIVMHLENSARQSGQQISDDVVFHGGAELLEDLASLSGVLNIHDFDEKDMEGALYRALDIYREGATKSGRLNRKANVEDLAAVMNADRQGALGEIFPELQSRFGGKEGAAPADDAEADDEGTEPDPEDEDE